MNEYKQVYEPDVRSIKNNICSKLNICISIATIAAVLSILIILLKYFDCIELSSFSQCVMVCLSSIFTYYSLLLRYERKKAIENSYNYLIGVYENKKIEYINVIPSKNVVTIVEIPPNSNIYMSNQYITVLGKLKAKDVMEKGEYEYILDGLDIPRIFSADVELLIKEKQKESDRNEVD